MVVVFFYMIFGKSRRFIFQKGRDSIIIKSLEKKEKKNPISINLLCYFSIGNSYNEIPFQFSCCYSYKYNAKTINKISKNLLTGSNLVSFLITEHNLS